MTNSYDVDHGLSQCPPGPLEPVEIAQQDDTLARTGNTARDQEMYAAGIRTGEENAKHNAAIRAAAPGVSTVEDEEEPPQLPYVVQRILKFAGQNQRFVTLPNLSAQQAIDLANWIQSNLRPAPAAGDSLDIGREAIDAAYAVLWPDCKAAYLVQERRRRMLRQAIDAAIAAQRKGDA
ncbi:hypothetical protein ACOTF2_06995 [Achromobacter xylosoxidans]